jgi:hypothetical protein
LTERIDYIQEIPSILLRELKEGTIIPVIGAGFSRNAQSSSPDRIPPTWKKLGKLFGDELQDYDYKDDPLESISLYCDRNGKGYLYERLHEYLCIDHISPGPAHRKFTELPFELIITTNFDCLLEDAFRNGKKPYAKIYSSKDYSVYRSKRRKILKIHGDVENFDSIVVTKKQYELVSMDNSLYKYILKTLIVDKTLLFIGYSLSDPDFLALLKEVKSDLQDYWRRPFALLINPSPDIIDKFRELEVTPVVITNSKQTHNEIFTELFQQVLDYINTPNSSKFSYSQSHTVNSGFASKLKPKDLRLNYENEAQVIERFNVSTPTSTTNNNANNSYSYTHDICSENLKAKFYNKLYEIDTMPSYLLKYESPDIISLRQLWLNEFTDIDEDDFLNCVRGWTSQDFSLFNYDSRYGTIGLTDKGRTNLRNFIHQKSAGKSLASRWGLHETGLISYPYNSSFTICQVCNARFVSTQGYRAHFSLMHR